MNQHKPKTVFEERDELKREIELLKSALDTARFTIAGMAESLAESRKLVRSLNADIEELTFCEDCGEDCVKLESNGCYPPRYCHGCRHKLIEQIVALREERDAAKRVADMTFGHKVLWSVEQKLIELSNGDHGLPEVDEDSLVDALRLINGLFDQMEPETLAALTAYRALTEPSDVMSRPTVRRALSITTAAEDGRLAGVVERVREAVKEVR